MRRIFVFLMLASICGAQSISKANWTATPGVIRQSAGKYPATANVVVSKNDCPRDGNGKATNPLTGTGSTYTIFPTGVGISASSPTVGDCTLATILTIDPSAAQPGIQFLLINEQLKGATTSTGSAVLAMMDSTAGPTPSTPEVDVIWDVISKHVCADSFGKHVPASLYCIEVKIGNNSSHGIQLAGVGFKIKHPFAGLAGIPPDATLTSANTAYQTTRSMAQAGGDISVRNLAYKSLQATGLIMASFTPFFKNTNHKANWSTASAIVSGALVQSFDLIYPDHTVRELTNLDDQSFRDGKLIPNNTQVRMIVFMDKELIQGTVGPRCTQLLTKGSTPPSDSDVKKCTHSDDPTIVKILLGDMVIVGDKIDYIERVVVDTGVTSQEVNASLSVTAALAADDTITLTGTGLAGATVTLDGTAIPSPTNQTATQIQFKPSSLTAGDHTVQVKSSNGQQTQTITVTKPKP